MRHNIPIFTRPVCGVAMLMLLLLCSCDHKDLCYDHPHSTTLALQFDWDAAPEARPEGMCAHFYRVDDPAYHYRVDYQGREGGPLSLLSGTYRVIFYNNDISDVLEADTHDYSRLRFYTLGGYLFEPAAGGLYSPTAMTDNNGVAVTPEMMWGGTDLVTVSPSTTVVCLCPETMICRYTCEIRNVSGLASVERMCASMGGLAPALFPASGIDDSDVIVHSFETRHDGESLITGSFLTFGCAHSLYPEQRLLVYLWLSDGSKLVYGISDERFNVHDQIANAPDPFDVHIVIDGLAIPETGGADSGFQAMVDDWIDYEQNISY